MAVQSSKTGAPRKKQKMSAKRPMAPQVVSGPKVLRIGIIQGGRIIEERIIRKRDTVTVGQSEKNTFVVVSSELPSRFEMFENRGGNGYTLQFTKEMKGRISAGGAVKELVEIAKSKESSKKGRVYRFPLEESVRGKIVVGDSTILFQFVNPPPIQPKPQLPAAARGGLFKNIEWFMTVIWLAVMVIEVSFFTFLETHDWPIESKWDKYMKLQELITPAQDATFEKKKVEKTEEGEGDEAEEEEEKVEEEKPKKAPEKTKPTENKPQKSPEQMAKERQERQERRAAIAEQLAQRGINKIIGSLGGEGEGAIIDVLGQGDVGADQDALLKQVSGVDVATGDVSSLRGPAGGKGSGEAADIAAVRMKGGDATVKTGGAGTERRVKGNVKRKNAAAVDGTGALSPQEVNKVIGRRMGAIKGCYERALRRNPGLKGKLVVRFTISGSGRVTTARAVENGLTPDVGNCVVSAFKRFRFPQPDGGSLTMESPFMFLPSN